jgi:hypothetical protein
MQELAQKAIQLIHDGLEPERQSNFYAGNLGFFAALKRCSSTVVPAIGQGQDQSQKASDRSVRPTPASQRTMF